MRRQRRCCVLLTSYEHVGLLVSMALVVNVRDGCPQCGFRYELSSAQMGGLGCIDDCTQVALSHYPSGCFVINQDLLIRR